ncbi:MAG: plastocyanin/azurin family copper-binding protein [Nitrosopumilus sp.]|nr:plastocyanin/azurin family copper-binding protein [Nitrosopumilus sp.]MDF2422954.1 plastocyanin/azurin family copper-binding protein [Nitrosopumilus sp.]MDF2424654.1 plastocyanin/azurin family copper-binding protein [Nitrosopumilus sp.]MDF2424811.1 plastocyanin/azurin family copper-binding protein [Nitrosopumilus sp.]MDF2427153.1 plastocyanin/azurin family copper-binding protein [Nitrosopumilus sp.]
MSNWDLMMPGMGLTAIGVAGLTLSYAGIAHTFIDGMHALTGLTMFVGLIILVAGILDGGISTSNRAKATTLVIVSIGLGFGMYAMVMNTSNYTVTIAGILMAIAFPAIIIAYLSMKHPTVVKPIGAIVSIAAVVGIIMWVSFGIFSAPDTYMIPRQAGVEEPAEDLTPSGPIFAIEILKDSVVDGNPDYSPDIAVVTQGYVVEWTNADSVVHTVTSTADFGETFDSSLISPGEVFSVDSNNLEAGEHEYLCIVHPWMVATLVIEAAEEPTKVMIPKGAAVPKDGNIFYDPETVNVAAGTTILWENADHVMHTATSGNPNEGADGMFDSDILSAGDTYEFTFADAGTYDYWCILHPWMIGTVNVE